MASFSMTGFGRSAAESDGLRVEVELSAVNRRQFDFSFSAPQEFAAFEPVCRTWVNARVSRGRINAQVSVRATQADAGGWDVAAVRERVGQLRRLADAAGVADDITLRDLLALPDFSRMASRRLDEAVRLRVLEEAVDGALDRLCGMRETEGAALAVDLTARIERLRGRADTIARLAPDVPKRHQELLRKRIAELGVPLAPDDPSLAREVAICADRCDVSEELTRLSAHVDHFLALLAGEAACGRKLDFLCQEMNREINTIGSKAGDAAIATHVIEMKALVETIREQVQNIE